MVSIGVLFASNRGEAIATWTGSYSKIYLMTLATAWLVRTPADFALAVRVFVLAGCMVALVALYNKASGIGLVEETRVTIGRELGSVLGDPNDLALVLLFPAGFSLSLLLNQGNGLGGRLLGGLGFALTAAAIIATQSRGGLLGICAVCGLFAWQRVKSKTLLIMAGTLALSVLFVAAGISDRASGGAAESGVDASAMGRIYAWQAAWGMALGHPLVGVGLSNFYYNYFFYSPHWDGLNHAVHSTWFGGAGRDRVRGLGTVYRHGGVDVAPLLAVPASWHAPCSDHRYARGDGQHGRVCHLGLIFNPGFYLAHLSGVGAGGRGHQVCAASPRCH